MRKEDSQSKQSENQEELKYKSMYVNLDRMLRKLPEAVVEDLNIEFINTTHKVLKNYDRTSFSLEDLD
jgi:hypothetical protein